MTDSITLILISTLAQPPSAEPTITKPDLSVVSEHATSAGLLTTNWLLIAAGAILLLLSALSIANWWKHRGDHAHPLLVFSGTAEVVGLTYRQRWTLLKIARNQSLTSPLTLMLSPTTYDHHAKGYLESRMNWRRESTRRQLNDIRIALFSDLPHSPAAA